jgi:hypothetical protein
MLTPDLPAREVRITDSGGTLFIYRRDHVDRDLWYLTHSTGEKVDPDPITSVQLLRAIERVM